MTRLPISEARRDGTPILTKIRGQWMILWWYDAEPSGYVDTVTYGPGWIDGSRDRSGSRNTSDRLNVFNPEFFYRLPEEN